VVFGCKAEGDGGSPRAGSGGGAGSPGMINVRETLERRVDCAVEDSMLGINPSSCNGRNEFTACLQSMCGLQNCEGTCGEYAACLQTKPDICENDCMPSDACADCSADLSDCGTMQCLDNISCGPVTPGGPCDQLAMCCAALPDAMRANCEMFVPVGRAGGDTVCTNLKAMIGGCM
jgi:hypothetical protein